MNRCWPLRARPAWLLGLALGFLSPTTLAQSALVRSLPPQAMIGNLRVDQPPLVTLDDQPERLSPGARIHGPDNLLVLSATLVGQTLTVGYLRDTLGLVHEVWILNTAERAAVDARQPPVVLMRP